MNKWLIQFLTALVAGLTMCSYSMAGDGDLDTSFDTDGKVTTNIRGYKDMGNSVAIQSDGKIVVAGRSYRNATQYDFGLVRYNIDGSLDDSFDTDGKVITAFEGNYAIGRSVAVQTDGKIVVAGDYWRATPKCDFAVARYNTNGSLDTGFGTSGKATTPIGSANDWCWSVAIQSDGKIVTAGYIDNGSDYDFAVVRWNTNGVLDTSFSGDGIVTTAIGSARDYGRSVAIQSDSKIVVAGYSDNGSDYDFAVARYNTNGSLDTSFNTDGKVTTAVGNSNDYGMSVAIQSEGKMLLPDGKIVVAGRSYNGSDYDFAVVRYKRNGNLDGKFSGDGKVTTAIGSGDDYGESVAIQSDWNIVVAGYSVMVTNDFAVVRYDNSPPAITLFIGY